MEASPAPDPSIVDEANDYGPMDDASFNHTRDMVIIGIGLALVQLLSGQRFQKKDMAVEIDTVLQRFAIEVSRRNEKAEVESINTQG